MGEFSGSVSEGFLNIDRVLYGGKHAVLFKSVYFSVCILCNEYYNVSTSNTLRAGRVITNTVYCSYKPDIKVGGKLLT